MDVENKKGCMVTGMMSFSESELNELRKLRDNGEPLEPEELRAVNRKELFDRNRKPEPTASEPMPEPVAEPTPDTTIGATYRKVYETWLEQSKTGHPTERSIAEALGKTVSTIHHHVANMVRDGYLVKDAIREREYVLTGKPFNPSDTKKAKQSPDTLDRIREETVRLQNEGVAFDPAEYARIISERVGKSKKTVRNNFATLRKEGILPPAENPFASQRKPKPEPEPKPAANKEEPMSQTTTPKITAGTIATTNPTPRDITTTEVVPEKHYENPRAIIANALVGIYDSISALQRAAYHANDKVVYGFATKLMNGELMDIKANYSKDTK